MTPVQDADGLANLAPVAVQRVVATINAVGINANLRADY